MLEKTPVFVACDAAIRRAEDGGNDARENRIKIGREK